MVGGGGKGREEGVRRGREASGGAARNPVSPRVSEVCGAEVRPAVLRSQMVAHSSGQQVVPPVPPRYLRSNECAYG